MVLRVVLDTNVIFEGLTKQGGACGLLIDAWQAGLLTVCVSNTLLHEYDDVLARKLSESRYVDALAILNHLLDASTQLTSIYYSWRPMSPDPGDDHVIDCAMNANAIIITANIRDFRSARNAIGLQIMSPVELLSLLVNVE